jgi:hypothetical protein
MPKVLEEAKRFLWLHSSGVAVVDNPVDLIAELIKELEKFTNPPKRPK